MKKNKMLVEINRLPHKFIKDLDLNLNNLKAYLVQDFDMNLLKNMVDFGLNIFGELGMNEWGLVPQIRHGSVYVLKKEDQTNIVGLAILMRDWENAEKVYLFDYAIQTEMQGYGIGRQFLKVISDSLMDQGFSKMSLTVDVENEPAIRLYKHIGFNPVEYSPNEYGEGHKRYIMEWNMGNIAREMRKKAI